MKSIIQTTAILYFIRFYDLFPEREVDDLGEYAHPVVPGPRDNGSRRLCSIWSEHTEDKP